MRSLKSILTAGKPLTRNSQPETRTSQLNMLFLPREIYSCNSGAYFTGELYTISYLLPAAHQSVIP